MRLNIKATNFELTPDIKDYLAKKTAKIEEIVDLHKEDALLSCEVGKETKHHRHGDVFRAELQISFLGELRRAVAHGETIFSAIDVAKDELERAITQQKDKHTTRIRRGGRAFKNFIRRLYR